MFSGLVVSGGATDAPFGPFSMRVLQVVFEGVPSYPDVSRLWEIVDKYQVSHLYTAPTAIRSLMKEGDHHVSKEGGHRSHSNFSLLFHPGRERCISCFLMYHLPVVIVGDRFFPQVAAPARQCGRAHQPRGLEVVSRGTRPWLARTPCHDEEARR